MIDDAGRAGEPGACGSAGSSDGARCQLPLSDGRTGRRVAAIGVLISGPRQQPSGAHRRDRGRPSRRARSPSSSRTAPAPAGSSARARRGSRRWSSTIAQFAIARRLRPRARAASCARGASGSSALPASCVWSARRCSRRFPNADPEHPSVAAAGVSRASMRSARRSSTASRSAARPCTWSPASSTAGRSCCRPPCRSATTTRPRRSSARILVEEHRIYPEAVRIVLAARWRVDGRRFFTS